MPEHQSHHGYQIHLTGAVYEPAEDSYLLIDAALNEIVGSNQRLRIIEIGTGSGIVTAAMMRDAPEHRYAATDISPHAVACAKANRVPVVRADLFSGIRGRFDLIVFNAPYLPTAPDECVDGWLDYAWNGGDNGRVVIDRFFVQAPAFLADHGSILLLFSSLTGIEAVRERMASAGLLVREVASVRCPGERLVVLRGSRPPSFNTI
uniref:Release factor glutamine methyltransferase n=1 Tax=Candidatus Methanogaster sp. ANME-2c ERB4 TaxID=2759911 RepID=A0A7G9YMJ2_9EURY|nr:HemK related protein [uncultured archaeon GZfos17F1]QNO49226.1 release factor glutamine methyltransferase [Methanosarcinales archaeon ANME-2c ERB4]QNO49251.1 release factor glutamine methyltransferase [Methanosarcinales archaeon ANME-2c ERB4]